MKRIIRICFFFCITTIPLAVYANDYISLVPDFYSEYTEEITGYGRLADLTDAIVNGTLVSDGGIINKIINLTVGDIGQSLKYIVSVIGFCILSSCIKGSQIKLAGASVDVCFLVCYMVVSGFLLGILRICTDIAFKAADDIVTFTKLSLPAYIGIVTSTGVNVKVSEGIFLAMVNTVSTYAGNYMIDAFFYIGILTVISNMSKEIHISKLINITRQILFWILGFLLTVFAGMTSLSGINMSKAAGTAMRAVKYTVGHTVPVVGGFLADSAELILASATVFKAAFGTAGIIVLAVLCIIPVAKLFLIGFLLKFAAGLTEPFCDKSICDAVFSVGQSIVHIMVCVLLMTVMFVLAFAVLLNV